MSSLDPSGITESIANLSITTTHLPEKEQPEEQVTPRQEDFQPTPPLPQPQQQQQAESSSSKRKLEKFRGSRSSSSSSSSGSNTETEPSSTKMPSGSSSKHHSSSSSSKKHHSSSSSKHSSSKHDDWADVTEPEERRRIQNRIAQRKFREKARDQKERQERDARNQEFAGSSYAVPFGSDLAGDDQLSGLPWGGLNIPHMVARGHESASQQGSWRDASDQQYDSQQQQQYYDPQFAGGSFGGDDMGGSAGGTAYGYDLADDRYFDTSASSSSPSYFSYDAFSGDGGSSSGRRR